MGKLYSLSFMTGIYSDSNFPSIYLIMQIIVSMFFTIFTGKCNKMHTCLHCFIHVLNEIQGLMNKKIMLLKIILMTHV